MVMGFPHVKMERLIPLGGELTFLTFENLFLMLRINMAGQVGKVVTPVVTVGALVDSKA